MERTKISKRNGGLFETIELLADFIYRHPIISAAWLCMCCTCISTGGASLTGTSGLMLGTAGLGGAIAVYYYGHNRDKDGFKFSIIIGICGLAAALLFGYWGHIKGLYGSVILNGGLAAVGGIFLCLAAKNKLTVERVILLLFAAGFMLLSSLAFIFERPMPAHTAITAAAAVIVAILPVECFILAPVFAGCLSPESISSIAAGSAFIVCIYSLSIVSAS